VRRVEGEKREAESCWKSGGGRTRLYTWPRVGVADEAGSDTIPNAAGGEGGHGVAKLDPSGQLAHESQPVMYCVLEKQPRDEFSSHGSEISSIELGAFQAGEEILV
jgi:hypothetical protein